MIALILSVVLSTYLVICFKIFERFNINTFQAIVFNYITCLATGILISQGNLHINDFIPKPWLPFALFLGCSFFLVFNLMGYVANHIGATVTSVASKLSMVIPVIAAMILYHDSITIIKVIAVVLALIAVYLVSVKDSGQQKHLQTQGIILAAVIFLASGINDSVVNYVTLKLLRPEETSRFNIAIFLFAACSGIIVLIIQLIIKKKTVQLKNVSGGILLGVPNYFSLFYLIVAIRDGGWSSSVIFPVNNMGIVILTAASAYLLFKERFSKMNLTGLAIALVAIALILIA